MWTWSSTFGRDSMKGLLVFAIEVRRSRRPSMERAPATLAMLLMELAWVAGSLSVTT